MNVRTILFALSQIAIGVFLSATYSPLWGGLFLASAFYTLFLLRKWKNFWSLAAANFIVYIAFFITSLIPYTKLISEGNSTLLTKLFCLLTIASFIMLIYLVNYVYEREYLFDDTKEFDLNDLIKKCRTNRSENLAQISHDRNVLLVFIRHFGCTFCRENVNELSRLEQEIKQKGLHLVFVHMSDPSFGDDFFSRYYNYPISHISDPARRLYKAFGLKRGTLLQLFGLSTWIKGIYSALIKGNGQGAIEGDSFQLGGYFVLRNEKVIFSHYNKNASEKFSLENLQLK